jgi:hydroxymethylglutaryl-CoA lyase
MLTPKMADTPSLLPRLRPIASKEQEVYYPVLVPNMRGLENLFKLEDENKKAGRPPLTNEIAIFVAASDVGLSLETSGC